MLLGYWWHGRHWGDGLVRVEAILLLRRHTSHLGLQRWGKEGIDTRCLRELLRRLGERTLETSRVCLYWREVLIARVGKRTACVIHETSWLGHLLLSNLLLWHLLAHLLLRHTSLHWVLEPILAAGAELIRETLSLVQSTHILTILHVIVRSKLLPHLNFV